MFNKVTILCENDEYYIVQEGESYGLSNYDHIVQTGTAWSGMKLFFSENGNYVSEKERRIELLRENLEEVEARIRQRATGAGRKREEVTLISVSKTKPVETLKEAYDLGVRVFGENKVQEIREKYEALPKDIECI